MSKKHEKFFGKEWAQMLQPFLSSKDYERIGRCLLEDQKQGLIITPDLKHVFRAFSECPYHRLHSVIVGMDPYSNRDKDDDLVADGLAFSARNSEAVPKSLNNIYEALDVDVFNGGYLPRGTWNQHKGSICHSLEHWAKDGILLLNCGLTTTEGRSNAHINLWRPFIEYVMRVISMRKDGIGFILMGTHARSLRPLLDKNFTNAIFECEHPVAGEYTKRSWIHNNVFSDLTNFHHNMNNIKIDW